VLNLDDTIAAIATAPGAAGLAVVRLSGERAIAVAEAVFEGEPLSQARGHTLHHGWAVWPAAASGETRAPEGSAAAGRAPTSPLRLDEVVAAVFRAPRSYTREDTVEFSCHGGRLSAERVLAALLAAGARLARPGEFTLRAFLSGRLDLVQAEAVADLIQAETAGAHDLALSQLSGELSRRLAAISESLRDAAAEVEARVDFAEDVGGIEVPVHVVETIAGAEAALARLLKGASYARAVREGVRVVLAGRPNVGKSSLFNALLGERRAIVTADPGTTRDLVSEGIEVAGVRVTLTDTAGLREGGGEAEGEGVARARAAIEQSAVVLWVVDSATLLEDEDRRIAAQLAGRRVVVALNKRDLSPVVERAEVEALLEGTPCTVMGVSALSGEGIAELWSTLGGLLRGDSGLAGAVANRRHAEALERAQGALGRARAAAAAGSPGEIVALELHESLGAIGEVTGETVGEDLLERIFSRFCIGK
jgi:tRNA modification GTPase